MRIQALGPLRVECDGAGVPLGTAKQRQVLALLLARANNAVPVDDLVDELWANDPPASALANLRLYANNLSRLFAGLPEAPVLTRHGTAYTLTVVEDRFDVACFRRAVRRGRELLGRDERAAAAAYDEGLGLWRGRPADDAPAGAALAAWRVALEEERLAAVEERADALLRMGAYDRVTADTREVLIRHPLRERTYALLARARYEAGDIAGALAAVDEARRRLGEELGVDPGEELLQVREEVRGRRTPPAARSGATARQGVIKPRQLPVGVAGFAGRADRLRQLDALVPGDSPTTVVISAIGGAGGVGKTALAVHWAHRVADRFPDGQLYVNLRGFDPTGTPMTAAEALRTFLDAFELPPARIPAGIDARAALYRSLLADQRMLILLDNARDTDQVRPLLPGTPGCLALVTSRNQLAALIATEGAHSLSLDVLTDSEAHELLTRRIGRHRVTAEPRAVAEIIHRCARLPLALAIAAARAATRPELPLAGLADELRAAGGALDAFADDDPATDIRAVLSWSYRILGPDAARLFRLLGLHPGPDISVPAVASLAGLPPARVRPLLAELTRAHLLTEELPGRYSFHDLLRAYAHDQAHAHDSDAAVRAATHRVLDHYLHTARAGAAALQSGLDQLMVTAPQPGVVPEPIDDQDQAMAWFTAEHPVLLACVAKAAATGFDTHAWQLPNLCVTFLHRQGHWQDWATTHHAALEAAQRAADETGQAHAHRGIGSAYTLLGRYDDAHAHLSTAVELYRGLGDRFGQAHAHGNLSYLFERQGRHREALDHAQQTLELCRAANHRPGEARALSTIGWFLVHLGEYARALDHCEQALLILSELDDLHGLTTAWDSLGYTHHHLGNHAEARACYGRAVDYARLIGDRDSEAEVLTHLGDSHRAAGDVDAARVVWLRAARILDELGNPEVDAVRARIDQLTSA